MRKFEKTAIIGGTGKAGKYLIDQLISQGYSIKVLARNPDKLTQKSPRIELVKGNVRDYASIYTLLTGCDTVISTLGPSKGEPDTCSIAVSHIIKAMQELKIKRYIEVAGLAIDTPDDKKRFQTRLIVKILKWFFPAVINDRQKDYALLAGSNIDWTIVRCPMIELTDAKRSLKTSLSDCPGRKVSANDLAIFLISQLYDDRFIRKCPFVAS
jgi:putative NADH-flavin reductase